MSGFTQIIPQVVPSSRCFSCDVCCRFPEKESFLRPFFGREEIQAAVKSGISAEFFPDPDGCQIRLIPHPGPGGEGYICPCFNPENGHCKIYDVRPLDCQLYPLSLMRDERGEGVLLGLDAKCPHIREEVPREVLEAYVKKVTAWIESGTLGRRIVANPSLIHKFQEDVGYLVPLERLAQTLKGPTA